MIILNLLMYSKNIELDTFIYIYVIELSFMRREIKSN